MTKEQFETITKWQKETFPNATSLSKVAHLVQEVDELGIAITYSDENVRLEFADCIFLLFGAAAANEMTYEDICDAVNEKFEINKKRIWGNPDENGVVNHVPSNAT